jgi:hypothetical protein
VCRFDYPIFIETTGQKGSPLSDLLFPSRLVAEVKEKSAQMLTTDIQLRTLHTPLQWSGVGAEHQPRTGRVVYPALCEMLVNWIKEIDGPIWNVRFAAAPAERIEDFMPRSTIRHAASYDTLRLH